MRAPLLFSGLGTIPSLLEAKVRKDIATSLGIIAFCLILVQQTAALPKARFEPLGPAFFPLMVLSAIVALSSLNIALVLWRTLKSEQPRTVEAAVRWSPTFDNILPWASLLAFITYILLLSYSGIPYLILTFVFVAVLSWAMASFRKGAIIPAVGVAAGLAILIQGVFVTLLKTALP
ncbi:tripartite tricarboxylate transporter TctB family protein [Xanthobacteraceae bacterium Astr-EGSB]|uniref:tripartite tricarboxylate transporter TctB family protein n=1 Tax=Astrobacterium formosum TaxID=3069710 RepID=UPI0027B55C7A|nr:tripartite tricarboxylate transporter TctB family protein [Xanthobacteraceae bacterium Astr-EGSB]